MTYARMLVALPPEVRKNYQERAKKRGVLLRTLHNTYVGIFLTKRALALKEKQPMQYLAAKKGIPLVNVILPQSQYNNVVKAADADGVSIRQLVHTALMTGVRPDLAAPDD